MKHRLIRAVLVLTLTLLAAGRAAGQEISCDVLLAEAQRRGEAPSLAIDTTGGQVLLRTSFGSCREAAAKWSRRRLAPVQLPGGAMSVRLPTAKLTSPATPPSNEPTTRPGTTGRFATQDGRKCDLHLGNLWKPVRVQLTGGFYWLDRVFTIDLDGNGTTDNLGFRFRNENGGPDLNLQYYGVGGEVGVSELPGLALTDETVIPRVCFGSLHLEHPSGRFDVPAQAPQPEPEPPSPPEMSGVLDVDYGDKTLWIGVGIATVLVLLLGILTWIVRKVRGKGRKGSDLLPSEFADEWEGDDED